MLESYSRGDSDPSGQIILSFAFVPIIDLYLVCVNLMHGRPEPYPPVFKEFEEAKNIYSTTRITKMTGVVAEVDWMNKIGYRYDLEIVPGLAVNTNRTGNHGRLQPSRSVFRSYRSW